MGKDKLLRRALLLEDNVAHARLRFDPEAPVEPDELLAALGRAAP